MSHVNVQGLSVMRKEASQKAKLYPVGEENIPECRRSMHKQCLHESESEYISSFALKRKRTVSRTLDSINAVVPVVGTDSLDTPASKLSQTHETSVTSLLTGHRYTLCRKSARLDALFVYCNDSN